jgi:hypothetical protein
MSRVFCTVAVAFVVASFVGLQTAKADLLTKDSADFKYKYEMDADPAALDLAGTPAGVDFAGAGTAGTLSTLGDGTTIMTQSCSAYNHYTSLAASLPGAVMGSSDITYANGWTLEFRVKTAGDGNMPFAFALEAGTVSDNDSGQINIGNTLQTWGTVDLGATVNSDAFHMFRLAHLAGQNVYRIWRDNAELASGATLAGWMADGSNIYFGKIASNEGGAYDIDYLRVTPGAYAPVPEPGTIALLSTGLLGFLAYAWRTRN